MPVNGNGLEWGMHQWQLQDLEGAQQESDSNGAEVGEIFSFNPKETINNKTPQRHHYATCSKGQPPKLV